MAAARPAAATSLELMGLERTSLDAALVGVTIEILLPTSPDNRAFSSGGLDIGYQADVLSNDCGGVFAPIVFLEHSNQFGASGVKRDPGFASSFLETSLGGGAIASHA